MIKRLLIVGIILATLIGGLAYFQLVFKPQMIKGFIAAAPKPPVTVTTENATRETWIARRHSIGTLVALQGIDVAPQVGGIVAKIDMDSGRDVQKGAELVELDTSVERADLVSAQATQRQAELAYQRALELTQKGAGSVASLDQATANRDTAAASVNRVRALIAQKQIRAPFTGRLGIRKVDPGQYVSPGQALVSLQQLDPIRADFPMPEQDFARLKAGQKVEVGVDAYPGTVFQGAISVLDARVTQETRTLLVRAELKNPDLKLLPGMFGNITVLTGEPEEVVTVPRTAVTYSLYGDSVYVVKPAEAPASASAPAGTTGSLAQPAAVKTAEAAPAPAEGKPPALKAERRFVKTGDARDERVAILSGLQPGEEVVTTGQIKLTPGAAIRIDNSARLKPPAERPRQ